MQRNYSDMSAQTLKDEIKKTERNILSRQTVIEDLRTEMRNAQRAISTRKINPSAHKKSNTSKPLKKSAIKEITDLTSKISDLTARIDQHKALENTEKQELNLLKDALISQLEKQQPTIAVAPQANDAPEQDRLQENVAPQDCSLEYSQFSEALHNYETFNEEQIHKQLINASQELLKQYKEDPSAHAKKILIAAKNILENNSPENREILNLILKNEFDAKQTSNVLIAGTIFSGAALLVAATALTILSITVLPLFPLFFLGLSLGMVGATNLGIGIGLHFNRRSHLASYEKEHANIRQFALQAHSLFQQQPNPARREEPSFATREVESLLI